MLRYQIQCVSPKKDKQRSREADESQGLSLKACGMNKRPSSAAGKNRKRGVGYVAALEEKVEQLEHVIEELESPRKRSVQSEDVLDKIQTLKREQDRNRKVMHRMVEEKRLVEKKLQDMEDRYRKDNTFLKTDEPLEEKLDASRWAKKVAGIKAKKNKDGFKKTVVKPFSFAKEEDHSNRRSIFHEQKEEERMEKLRMETEAEERRLRALKGKPPKGIIQRGEEAIVRKNELIQKREMEEMEKRKAQQFKARDPPAMQSSAIDEEYLEQCRKERILKRAEENLSMSKLPPRMENSVIGDGRNTRHQNERNHAWKPKDVPNFTRLHYQWDTALKQARTVAKTTTAVEFRASQADRTADIKHKKAERENRKREERELMIQEKREKEKRAYEQVLKNKLKITPKHTKSQELRSQVVQDKLKTKKQQQQQELEETKARTLRIKKMAKEITPEILELDKRRKQEYQGNFVELAAASHLAKEKARESNRMFKESIKRNKERLDKALDNRPTLIQRFNTDKKKQDYKKNALASVVSNVFGNDLSNLEGIFSDEEEDLVHAIGSLTKASSVDEYNDDFE